MSSYVISQNHDLPSVMAGAFWLPICQIAGALAIIAAAAYVTYPRTRAPRGGWAVQL